jgi:hypothetical protein
VARELVIGHPLQVLGELRDLGGHPAGVGPLHPVLAVHVVLPAALQKLGGAEADPGVFVADQLADVELGLDGGLGGALARGLAVQTAPEFGGRGGATAGRFRRRA